MSEIFEELSGITLARLCEECGLDAECVLEFVAAGLITPSGRRQSEWRFDRSSIIRIRKAERLRRDLGVNLAGAVLALELLDEIAQLRSQLRLLTEDTKADEGT